MKQSHRKLKAGHLQTRAKIRKRPVLKILRILIRERRRQLQRKVLQAVHRLRKEKRRRHRKTHLRIRHRPPLYRRMAAGSLVSYSINSMITAWEVQMYYSAPLLLYQRRLIPKPRNPAQVQLRLPQNSYPQIRQERLRQSMGSVLYCSGLSTKVRMMPSI